MSCTRILRVCLHIWYGIHSYAEVNDVDTFYEEVKETKKRQRNKKTESGTGTGTVFNKTKCWSNKLNHVGQ